MDNKSDIKKKKKKKKIPITIALHQTRKQMMSPDGSMYFKPNEPIQSNAVPNVLQKHAENSTRSQLNLL
jgi:hypothetical protein